MSELKSWRDWWYWPFALVYFLGVTLYFAMNTRNAGNSVNWPSTAGAVTRTEATDSGNSNEDKIEKIAYTYTVNGQTYTSSRLSYGDTLIPPEVNGNLLAHFPFGQDVTVYYNPDNPRAAVLYPGNGYRPSSIILPAVLVFAIVVAVLSFYFNRRGQIASERPAR